MRFEWSTLWRASTYSPSGRFRSPSIVSSSKLMTVFFSYSILGCACVFFSCAAAKSGAAITTVRRSLRIFWSLEGWILPSVPCATKPASSSTVGRVRRRGGPLGGCQGGASVLRGLRGLLGRLPGRLRLHLLRRLRGLAVLLELRLAFALQPHDLRALGQYGPGAVLVRLQLRQGGLALRLHPREEHAAGEVDLREPIPRRLLRPGVGRERVVGFAGVAQREPVGELHGGIGRLELRDRRGVLGDAAPRLLPERAVEERVAGGEEPLAERERLAKLDMGARLVA